MYHIIKRSEWQSLAWSGGTTNQLYIYPESGDYPSRNFLARISIAETLDEARSPFTSLPGVDRYISNLEGEMKLEHEEHYNIEVKPYEIERFQGDWLTFSTGKYRDFNLMLKGVRGDLYFKEIHKHVTLHLQEELTFAFLYVIEGELLVNDSIHLEETDLLIAKINKLEIQSGNAKVYYGFVKEWDKSSK